LSIFLNGLKNFIRSLKIIRFPLHISSFLVTYCLIDRTFDFVDRVIFFACDTV